MARRSNGEGSFYQQKDKSWVYQVTYGRKEDGKPYRKSFKGRTKTICKERRAQWEEEQARIKAEEEAQAAESACQKAVHLCKLSGYLSNPLRGSLWKPAALPDHAGHHTGLLSKKAEKRRSFGWTQRRPVRKDHSEPAYAAEGLFRVCHEEIQTAV